MTKKLMETSKVVLEPYMDLTEDEVALITEFKISEDSQGESWGWNTMWAIDSKKLENAISGPDPQLTPDEKQIALSLLEKISSREGKNFRIYLIIPGADE